MRTTALLGATGALIGVVVGVIVHFTVKGAAVSGDQALGRRTVRYADYLPDGSGTHPRWLPLLGVSVGSGLVLGLLVGVVLLVGGVRLVRRG